jgi:hypothetical protein
MGRTRTQRAAGIVLDTGALIALGRGDKRMRRYFLMAGSVSAVSEVLFSRAC